ncbi:hypothetical protein G6F63_015290 [Rhizopus arrhizus]|nr:hypothetical protein G6F63_015290 [Rhizopus arrhizus]
MICSRLASAVTISTGRVFSLASARIALSSSMPVITGMFQSVTTKSNGWLCSSDSAACPSSASAVLVKPRSPSRFLTIRRMVEKSSTIRRRMFLFKAEFLCCSFRAAGGSRLGDVHSSRPASAASKIFSRPRRRSTAWPWIWQTRDSLTPSTAPISFRFSSCS